jgi:hypothetical protein
LRSFDNYLLWLQNIHPSIPKNYPNSIRERGRQVLESVKSTKANYILWYPFTIVTYATVTHNNATDKTTTKNGLTINDIKDGKYTTVLKDILSYATGVVGFAAGLASAYFGVSGKTDVNNKVQG